MNCITYRKKYTYLFYTLITFTTHIAYGKKATPHVTIIFVVDQFAYHYIQKLSPNFTGGFKLLLTNGIHYTNAYVPHGMPATATGHAGLNTGCYAKMHGFVGNKWFNEHGKKVACDDDFTGKAPVFSPDGLYQTGKSPKNLMVPGISDQFVLASRPEKKHLAFSVSLKSRAAIATAGQLGKAVWFDNKTGLFTSSKAYFTELPRWIQQFNTEKKIDSLTEINWQLAYPEKNNFYNFFNTDRHEYSRYGFNLIERALPIQKNGTDNPYHFYEKTPQSNQAVMDLAKECLETHLNDSNHILLWICMSTPDKLGHRVGPESMEMIDLIYHIDKQIQDFIAYLHKKIDKKETLFVLTADHGVSYIPELLQEKGLPAQRISEQALIDELNTFIATKYYFDRLILHYRSPQFYLNRELFDTLSQTMKNKILNDIKHVLNKKPYVKHVWTYDELENACYEQHTPENHLKQQLYPNRSGQIIVQTYPNHIITKHKLGTSHKTPYENDIHVPLILYQPNSIEQKTIRKKVWALQLPNTLADILNIMNPPASTFGVLPGIFD